MNLVITLLVLTGTVFSIDCINTLRIPDSDKSYITKDADVRISLSSREILLSCPSEDNQQAKTSIIISTLTEGFETNELTYSYTVSAGMIRGNGVQVDWDLSGVRPGVYSITVGVSDGTKTKKSETMTVQVIAPNDCLPSCQTSITEVRFSRQSIKRGNLFTATALISGPSEGLTYHWEVTNGIVQRDSQNGNRQTITIKAGSTIGNGTALVEASGGPGCRAASVNINNFIVTR